jgi:hemolysin III
MSYTTHVQERANVFTHLAGAIFGLVATVYLVYFAQQTGDTFKIVSVWIYGLSLTLLYLASTIYHAVKKDSLKRALRKVDHSAIYLLIAGTYTPFTLIWLREGGGCWIFWTVWSLALMGIAYKAFFINKFPIISLIFYLAMGWLMVIRIDLLLDLVPRAALYWIAAGGFCYSFGIIFYVWKKLPFHHAVWHLFVLGGSICHFMAVRLSVI